MVNNYRIIIYYKLMDNDSLSSDNDEFFLKPKKGSKISEKNNELNSYSEREINEIKSVINKNEKEKSKTKENKIENKKE